MIRSIITGVLRTVLLTVGGAQVGQGWLSDDQLQQLVGAVLTIIAVVWQIVAAARRRTAAGGEFNPRAEVRKALPAQPSGPRPRLRRPWSHGSRREEGAARPAVIGALALSLLVASALYGCMAWAQKQGGAWRVERTETWPDIIAGQPDLAHYLKPALREDERPFFPRLLASLRGGVSGVRWVSAPPDGPKGAGPRLIPVWQLRGGAEF